MRKAAACGKPVGIGRFKAGLPQKDPSAPGHMCASQNPGHKRVIFLEKKSFFAETCTEGDRPGSGREAPPAPSLHPRGVLFCVLFCVQARSETVFSVASNCAQTALKLLSKCSQTAPKLLPNCSQNDQIRVSKALFTVAITPSWSSSELPCPPSPTTRHPARHGTNDPPTPAEKKSQMSFFAETFSVQGAAEGVAFLR